MIPQGHEAGSVGRERKDVDPIGLFSTALLVCLLLAVCLLGVWGFLRILNAKEERPPHRADLKVDVQSFPEPRLEVVPGQALTKDRAVQEAELRSYGWVDRRKRVARIPIERAMKLLVERGLPNVGGGQTPLQWMQRQPAKKEEPNESIASATP